MHALNNEIIQCRRCDRLVHFRESVPARASFKDEIYWRKPVPGFGDPHAWLLLVGLAPAAHGGNRTGRIFTGDESGRFLFNALYQTGFANQPTSISKNDGLILSQCYITAAVKCVPPKNAPTLLETQNCCSFLEAEFALLKKITTIIALGGHALNAIRLYAKRQGIAAPPLAFKHGASYQLERMPRIFCCYHPSPQNTYTKKLTETMMIELLQKVKK
jgi:uracil-DNA glycosylase family 4